MANDEKAPIIIKKVKKVQGGHHGGAWKVAYADFVTAMMAFFLLLWLLNVTTDEQKALISAYFAPSDPRVAESISGAGGVMGGTTMATEGAMTSTSDPVSENPAMPQPGETSLKEGDNIGKSAQDENMDGKATGGVDIEDIQSSALKAELDRRDEAAFKYAEEQIKQAIADNPDLQALSENLIIDMTPEGLRIQIVDQKGRPMFRLGSASPLPQTIKLLQTVSGVIQDMPNKISIRGHTDSKPYGKGARYTNWELSADRANASRRVLLSAELEKERIENIMGKADGEHLDKKDPFSPRNRRISIVLLKQSVVPGVYKKQPQSKKEETRIKAYEQPSEFRKKRQIKSREDGVIYFP